eukprot:scaffold10570_cov176-Amphora_coffeaeformis.AAC.16
MVAVRRHAIDGKKASATWICMVLQQSISEFVSLVRVGVQDDGVQKSVKDSDLNVESYNNSSQKSFYNSVKSDKK